MFRVVNCLLLSGRYEEHFIERRKQQLQAFVNAVCRHPVLSRGWVWRQHFITCTDEKRWKIGKRKAESRNINAETLSGPNMFCAIRAVSEDGGDQSPPPINPALLYVPICLHSILIIFILCLMLLILLLRIFTFVFFKGP